MKHAIVFSVATHARQPQTTKTGHLASARMSRRRLIDTASDRFTENYDQRGRLCGAAK